MSHRFQSVAPKVE